MTRPYTKKSEYWQTRKAAATPVVQAVAQTPAQPIAVAPLMSPAIPDIGFGGSSFEGDLSGRSGQEVVVARRTSSGEKDEYTSTSLFLLKDSNSKAHLAAMPLPYEYTDDGADIQETIELCQRAYANVAIFSNSINLMAEYSNGDYKITGGTAKSKKFAKNWLAKFADMEGLKEKFYLEFWRSGNVFVYRVVGSGSKEAFEVTEQDIKTDRVSLPVKYVFLNPASIVLRNPVNGDQLFFKRISEYESAKAREPENFARQLIDTQNSKKDIGEFRSKGIKLLPLDETKIVYKSAKRMDYEPFAIPFGFPVLDDINLKLEMKAMDKAISRIVTKSMLLVTMGDQPDKGGINPKNLAAMNLLLKKDAMGRALVSDYTTKAEFVLPDLKQVLFKEKYDVVNEDIKDGLSSLLFGTEAKYGNVQTKAIIFVKRMEPAIKSFEAFINKELEIACAAAGLIKPPTVKMCRVDIQNQAEIQKIALRLLELGVVVPEDAVEMIQNGKYPDGETLADKQTEYVKQREDGKFNPLTGGVPMVEAPDSGDASPKAGAPTAAPKAQTGRPKTKTMASVTLKDLAFVAKKATELETHILDTMKSKLGAANEALASELSEAIVQSKPVEEWVATASSCLESPEKMDLLVTDENVAKTSMEHGCTDYEAAIFTHAQKNFLKNTNNV